MFVGAANHLQMFMGCLASYAIVVETCSMEREVKFTENPHEPP
jgi:hypothetical protein